MEENHTTYQPHQQTDAQSVASPSFARKLFRGLMQFISMRIMNTYLFRTVGVTFLMSLVVVTFMMLMGSLVQIVELIFKKFSVLSILSFLAVSLPSVICYSLPFSMAGATLLVFSRLSADGEITAMKANGISIYRIATPPIILSILVGLVAVFAYSNILPRAHYHQKNIIAGYEIEDPSTLIETGSWIPMGQYRLFIEDREGKNLHNVQLVEDLPDGRNRRINARSGIIRYNRLQNQIQFEMYDVVSEERSNSQTNSFLRMSAGRVDMYIDMSKRIKKAQSELDKVQKDAKDQTSAELQEQIAFNELKLVKAACRQLSEFRELSQSNRMAFVNGLSEAEKTRLVKKMYATVQTDRLRWRQLQKQPVWHSFLKEKNLKSREAHDFLVSRPAEEGLDTFLKKLAEREGAGGPIATLLTEWYENWPQDFDNALEYRSRFKTEINYRLSYALASIAFAIIGIPLGIRAHRSEKTIGFLICLALIAVHYALVILVYQFRQNYTIYPYLLVWIPDLIFVVTGLFLMWRNHTYS